MMKVTADDLKSCCNCKHGSRSLWWFIRCANEKYFGKGVQEVMTPDHVCGSWEWDGEIHRQSRNRDKAKWLKKGE